VDPRVHRFEYIAAGQGPVMFVSGNFVESRPAGGIPLGVADAFRYGCEHFAFRAGDALVLLTDGFYEAGSSDRDLFGQERVLALLRKHGGRPLSEMIDVLHQGVCTFTGRQRQEDDLTALLVRRNDRR
jgi:sigma-B regulation protein RsbU (phosphoserine phosphatase)